MPITLRPEQEALIQEEIARGRYQTVEEFVEYAVRRLHEEEDFWASDWPAIEEKIERAIAQFDRGEYLSGEESRSELQERKAAWLAQRHNA